MSNSIGRTIILAMTMMFSSLALASQPGDALLQGCQAKAQGSADSYSAVMKCINEALQYDTSEGEGD